MQRFVLLSLAGALLAGCSYKSHSIPGAPIPFAKADYKVLGNTNAEECGTYIFGIDFAHLFKDQSAAFGASIPLLGAFMPAGGSPEGSRALYYALEKMPEATHLLEPRVHTSMSGIILGPVPLFGERCARVDAHGVQIGTGPTVNQ